MKKVIVALLLAVMMLCGCTRGSGSGSESESRMRMIETQYPEYRIYVDTDTGVCYLWAYHGGFTVMVDHTGKPYIANGWRDWGADDEED